MIVVKLMGGLGNQMFQYAFGKSLAYKLRKELYLDLDFLLDRTKRDNFVYRDFDLDIFKLSDYKIFDSNSKKEFYKSSLFNFRKTRPIIYKEKGFAYDSEYLSLKSNKIYIEGYWQSYKYFESIKEEIKNDFSFKNSLTDIQLELSDKLNQTESVCINFRRTDFVSIPSAIKTHGVPTLDYYYKSLDFLQEKLSTELKLYVFSDDIEWCKSNFNPAQEIQFIDHENYKGDRFSSYLQLMSQCKHFIIPNSTFAWWGAWLSSNSNKVVITPDRWFADDDLQSQTNDLRPQNWITL
jgi:hypothetical protein